MSLQKATGIVLSARTYGEGDVFSSIFTKEFGKNKYIFKGIKKSKKRASSGAEPGSVINFLYYDHNQQEVAIINEFNPCYNNLKIRSNHEHLFQLYFLLELVEKTIGYHDINQKLFNLLWHGINTIPKTQFSINLSIFFIIHLLKNHGLLSSLKKCKICQQEDYNDFCLDLNDFGLICSKCHSPNKSPKLFSAHLKEFIQKSLSEKFATLDQPIYYQENNKNFLASLSQFIENYFNIEIKSKKMVLN